MEATPDELAGIVDGFGALTRQELRTALEDLAARAGDPIDQEELTAAIDEAVADYYLVSLDPATALDGAPDHQSDHLLLPGPAALPELPAGGEDLPHLVDVEPRSIDRQAAAESVATRLRADAASAVTDDAVDRAGLLLDVCYAVEAWGPVSLDETKDELAELVDR